MAQPKITGKNETVTFKCIKGNKGDETKMFRSFHEVYLLLNGSVEFVCSSVRKSLKPFDVVVIPAGEYHHFIPKSEDYECIALNIGSGLLDDRLLKDAFGDKRILRLDNNDRIVSHLLYLKEAQMTASGEDFEMILSAVATDVIFLIKQSEKEVLFEESGLQHLSAEIMKYINANYKDDINLNTIAKEFFISVSTACHYFKEDFGVSIKQYIIEKKMAEAKMLIDAGQKTQDVCAKLGFDNYSTFFRAYKKHFGVSPKGKE